MKFAQFDATDKAGIIWKGFLALRLRITYNNGGTTAADVQQAKQLSGVILRNLTIKQIRKTE